MEVTSKGTEMDNTENTNAADSVNTVQEAGIKDLFRPKPITLRTLNMFYQWMAVTFAYYGLTFSSTDLAGDPYANFCSGVAIEIPGKSSSATYLLVYDL